MLLSAISSYMNIKWVLADDLVLDPTIDINRMKRGGTFWGSWKTWRAYNTDNVVCHNKEKAEELIKRDFQKTCNFYISNSVYKSLNQPPKVLLYEGDFMGHEVSNQDEIVAMNLAASSSDVLLLVGFDWSEQPVDVDSKRELRAKNYRGLVERAIKSRPDVQWILVDHPQVVRSELAELPNLDKDSFGNVFQILNG